MSLTYYSASDLAQFGVNALTGEACRYGMRVLCDLSDEGVDLICEFMGLPQGETVFAKNWNSMVGNAPATASIMLSRDVLKSLAEFAMRRAGVLWIAQGSDGTIHGYTETDVAHYKITGEELRRLFERVVYVGTVGSETRNVHAFTGRTV